jgi:hypothetical protein
MYYRDDPKKLAEAHSLNIQAISLEPDNINYRLNAVAVLMSNQRYDDALAVLKAASHVARTPGQVSTIQNRIGQIEQYQTAVAQNHPPQTGADTRPASTIVTDTRTNTIVSSDGRTFVIKSSGDAPKYPTGEATGLRHTLRGTLRRVHCGYPSVLTLTVEPSGKGQAVSLYRNDFRQIEFTAADFTPKSDLNPCTDIEGLKAKVQYSEVSDKSVAGQILSVELSK